MKNKPKKLIFIACAIFFLLLLLDYINIFEVLSLKIDNVNVEFLAIILDALIVIALYIISFYYIDNRQLEKDINSKNMVIVLIKKTCEECLSNLELLDKKTVLETFILPKLDANKAASENKVVSNLQTLPFNSFDTIMSLATKGYIDKKNLEEYLEIKKDYQRLVDLKIIFYDLVKPVTNDQQSMFLYIKACDATLRQKLKKYINNK